MEVKSHLPFFFHLGVGEGHGVNESALWEIRRIMENLVAKELTTTKVSLWKGENKTRVRNRKLELIQDNQDIIKNNPGAPLYLTFAGAQAHFEKGLVKRGLAEPWQITTVQTYEQVGNHVGKPFLKKLIRQRDKYLEGMLIWPHSFSSFCRFYAREDVKAPTQLSYANSKIISAEMESFTDKDFTREPFAVLDIDICGVFGPQIISDFEAMFKGQLLDDNGFLFFTHQKGRDSCGGKLIPFVKKYILENAPHFKPFAELLIELSRLEPDTKAERNKAQKRAYELIRYHFVPSFFLMIGAKNGYSIVPQLLMEYRDLNPETGAGNFMYQWGFRFTKLTNDSAKKAWQKVLPMALEWTMKNMDYEYEYLP